MFSRLIHGLVLASTLGCTMLPKDPLDPDGDGYPYGEDCDNSRGDVNPGADEVEFDGLDNDCDPNTPDEYAITVDADGDGYPSEDDCVDYNPDVNPGAAEICDYLDTDEDCDGVSDDDDPSVDPFTMSTTYYDRDGDGYGSVATSVESCDPPEGYVTDGSDCNDWDPFVNPAADETAGDGVDNDCNGLTDENDFGMGASGYLFLGKYVGSLDNIQCLEVYDTTALELEGGCDACDFTFEVAATWNDGLAAEFGHPSCGLNAFGAFIVPEYWTSTWSFAYSPSHYDWPVAYYGDGYGSWMPSAYFLGAITDGYLTWYLEYYYNTAYEFLYFDLFNFATSPSHATDLQPIWDEKCSGCHIGGGSSGSLSLDEGYSALVNVAAGELTTMDYVEPGDLDNSYLWRKLNDTHIEVGGSGTQMPKTGSLSAEQLATIQAWIEGGALP